MLCLRAIDPHGRRVVDENSISGDAQISHQDGHEAREDACQVGVHADRLARVVEVGLRDGVVLGHELKLHHIAFGGGDLVRRVSERAVRVADGYDVDGYLA
jgi:hypothetical protein